MAVYIDEFDHRIAGIPCRVGVTACSHKPGTYSSRAETPEEYYGETEMDWSILDRRGRYAPWLERKMTQKESDAIESIIMRRMNDGR